MDHTTIKHTTMKDLHCDRCEHRAESAIKEFCNNPDSPNYKKTPIPYQKACSSTKQKEEIEHTVIEQMRHNIKAYNKNMTTRYLRKQTPLQLLHLVHEMDRREFAIELCKHNLATTEEVQMYLRNK